MFYMSGIAAAAAAKLLPLCLTLCDPIDGSHYCLFKKFFWWCRITCGILILPPGTKPSPPALEAQCLYHWLSHFSHIWLFVTLWTVACQAPLSIRFFRQEYWRGLPSLLQGIFLTQGSNPHLSCLLHWFPGKSSFYCFKKHHFGCYIEDWLGQNEASHQRGFSLSCSKQVVWLLLFSFLLFLFCFVSSPFCFTILGPGIRTGATDGLGLRAEKPGDWRPRKLSHVTQVILPEPQLPSRQNVKQLGTRSSCSERLWALSEHHKQNDQVSAELTSWPPPPPFPCCGPGFLFQHLFLVLPKSSMRGSGMLWSLQAKMPGQGRSMNRCLFSGTGRGWTTASVTDAGLQLREKGLAQWAPYHPRAPQVGREGRKCPLCHVRQAQRGECALHQRRSPWLLQKPHSQHLPRPLSHPWMPLFL